jgi:hypothetical protein
LSLKNELTDADDAHDNEFILAAARYIVRSDDHPPQYWIERRLDLGGRTGAEFDRH